MMLHMRTNHLFLAFALAASNGVLLAQDNKPQPSPLLTQPGDRLIAVLKSGAGLKEKSDACRELAVIGNSKAIPALVPLLADEKLNHMARYALETMPDAGVNKVLRDELGKLKGRQLVGVIRTLGVRKDAGAVKPLSRLLSDADPDVAQAAARALGSIGIADAAKAIQLALPRTSRANQLAFCEGYFRCAEALAAAGKPKPALAIYDDLRGMTGLPQQVRVGAVRGAILTRGNEGMALLKESLLGTDYLLFAAAVRASMELNGADVTKALAAALPQLRPDNQVVVMQALGKRGDDAAVMTLLPFTRSGGKPTRLAAIKAVSEANKPPALPVLVELLGEADPEITQTAQSGIASMSGPEVDAAILAQVKDTSAARRVAGVEMIGRRRMTTAAPALFAAVRDADVGVRAAAFKRLGELAAPNDAGTLVKIVLETTTSDDLDAAEQALAAICRRADKPELMGGLMLDALAQAKSSQKAVLLSVLASIGGANALPAIRAASADADAEVRAAGIRALAEWPDLAAAPDLLKLMRSTTTESERQLAFRGYVRLAREPGASAEEKLKMMREAASGAASPQDKMLVLAGLGDISSPDSLKQVASYLSDPALADEAGTAAVKIAGKLGAGQKSEIAPVLNQVLKSAKSDQVLNQTRKRMEELGIRIE